MTKFALGLTQVVLAIAFAYQGSGYAAAFFGFLAGVTVGKIAGEP